MGLIPTVKCGRCDRTYSGLRSRCPYCGAHRHKKGKRMSDGDNATWKLIIGVLLIVVLIAAVVVILVTSASDKPDADKDSDYNPSNPTGDEGVDSKPGTDPDGTPGTNPDGSVPGSSDGSNPGDNPDGTNPDGTNPDGTTPGGDGTDPGDDTPATPQVVAQSVKIKSRWRNDSVDLAFVVGDTMELSAVITPSNVTSVPVWTSSDDSIVSLVPVDETGMKVKMTCIKKGTATVTVTVDDISRECIMRVR